MEKEEKIIKSDNEKGNPNHKPAGSPDGGQFTSADGSETVIKKDKIEDDDEMVFNLEEDTTKKPSLAFDFSHIKDFIGKKNVLKDQEAQKHIDQIYDLLDDTQKNYISSITKEEKLHLLKNSPQGYSEMLLKFATERQLDALLLSEELLNKPVHIEQKRLLAEKEKADIQKKIIHDTNDWLLKNTTYDERMLHDVWYGTVGLDQYEAKNTVDEQGTSPIERKRAYFNEIINSETASFIEKTKASANLFKLNKWAELGEKFLVEKSSINAKYVDLIEEAENKIIEANKASSLLQDNVGIFDLSRKFIEKFQDLDSAYSKARKDNATWITDKWIASHPEYAGMSIVNASVKHFGDKFEKMWAKMTSSERSRIQDYTGGGYSKYNKPLRGIHHSGWSGFGFAKAITEVTSAIDKCVWDEDIWVQRGISDSKIFKLPGSSGPSFLYEIQKNGNLQSLVGTTFKDNGFYSAGAGKGTGFSSSEIIFNTYCPKGTKMAYMNTKGHYAHGSENEMILQRGYSYRITKAEYKNGKYFIDCEVILNSDKDKVTNFEELEAIGNKYL